MALHGTQAGLVPPGSLTAGKTSSETARGPPALAGQGGGGAVREGRGLLQGLLRCG
jgi:hypothetical protein